MPNVVILAGPNGAGKSTAAPCVVAELVTAGAFVNADVIARGLSAFDSESVAFQAGRIMLDRLRELAAQRADFAFETTLASRTFAPFLRQLRVSGYRLELVYVWLPSADLCLQRVHSRFRSSSSCRPTRSSSPSCQTSGLISSHPQTEVHLINHVVHRDMLGTFVRRSATP
jgi:predicted ABC-type ATPase